MSKYRPDPLLLFYLPIRAEVEPAFDALVMIDEAIKGAKRTRQARTKLKALLASSSQTDQTKEFIGRILPLEKDRMERYTQSALRRLFTLTAHYHSALINRAEKAKLRNSE
jgi:hypothetical protein